MNIRNFDLNLLLVFDTLMKERHVSRAAEKLALSQPAISNALNRLRTLLNDQLFIRSASGMQPTAVARQIEEPIRKALFEIEITLNKERQFNANTTEATLNIATTDFIELAILPELIQILREEAPGIKIIIHPIPPDIPAKELEEGTLDVAIGRVVELPSRMKRSHWFTEQLVVAGRIDHPRLHDQLSLEEFLSMEHIWVSGGQHRGIVDTWLADNNYHRNIDVITPNYLLAPHLLPNTDYVVVMPNKLVSTYELIMPIKSVPLPLPTPHFDLDIVVAEVRADDPVVHWFIELLLTRFKHL